MTAAMKFIRILDPRTGKVVAIPLPAKGTR